RERGAADDDVEVAAQRCALCAAFRRAYGHGGRMIPGIRPALPFHPHMTTITTDSTDAKVVEGSDGLLLEIDGQIVPNYDATFAPFEEGEVVTGRVVRIDNDEVLVDIGYKSEGVIPNNELSIRKNVDPHDEVEM